MDSSIETASLLQEKPESDDLLDDEDEESEGTMAPSTYKMRPTLSEVFKAGKVKQVIQVILNEKLQGKNYSINEARIWTKQIADDVSIAVHDLYMRRYKHVVQVTLGQQLGSGCRYIARCRWDADCDGYTSEVFSNATLFCICTVFGIYLY